MCSNVPTLISQDNAPILISPGCSLLNLRGNNEMFFSFLDFKGLRLPSVTYRPCWKTGIDPLVMWYELKPLNLKRNLRLRKLGQIRR